MHIARKHIMCIFYSGITDLVRFATIVPSPLAQLTVTDAYSNSRAQLIGVSSSSASWPAAATDSSGTTTTVALPSGLPSLASYRECHVYDHKSITNHKHSG